MVAINLFGTIINIHRFEDGNLLLDFSPCSDTDEMLSISSHFKLFPLTWQKTRHKGSKVFDRKPLMLYTMTIKSLIHCWDNFEQNAKMLADVDTKMSAGNRLQINMTSPELEI